jgi:hypothetical protein
MATDHCENGLRFFFAMVWLFSPCSAGFRSGAWAGIRIHPAYGVSDLVVGNGGVLLTPLREKSGTGVTRTTQAIAG